MENQTNRTLASNISQTSQQSKGHSSEMGVSSERQTLPFWTVYSINLAHRFPDVTDVNSIKYDRIKQIAEFCLDSSNVGVETLEERQPLGRVVENRLSRTG